MIWLVLIAIFALTILWILLAPVIMIADSQRNRYRITLPGIFGASLVPADERIHLRINIFFIPFRINPFKGRKKKAARKKQKEDRKKRRRMTGGMSRGLSVLRTIRIKRLFMDIDTEDFTLNAQLIPVFSVLNDHTENITMQVNFEGRASVMLDARTRLGAMLWTYLIKR
jgi:hypothetical protein